MASTKNVQMIMQLTGVNEEIASRLYLEHETVEDALDAFFQKPLVAGDKYIPQKPTIDSGLSPEQEALCKRGRWLQDKVNVVFSVAHSKIRNQPDEESSQEVPEHVRVPPSSPELTSAVATPESRRDSGAKTPLPETQSETPQ